MSIKAACRCGAQFMAENHLAGKVVRCPTCGQNFQVPKPTAPRPTTPSAAPITKVACGCGKVYPVQPALYGKPVRCQACGRQFIVPNPNARTAAAVAPAMNPLDSLGSSDPFGAYDPLGGSLPSASDPLAGLGDATNWSLPASQPMAASYAMPTAAVARPKAKRKPFKVNKKLVSVIGLSVLATSAIVAIAIAAWIWMPLSIWGYSSPEAVYAAHNKAAEKHDWRTVYDTMTPDSQTKIVNLLAFSLKFTSSTNARVTEVLKRHNISSEAAPRPDAKNFAQAMQQLKDAMDSSAASVGNPRSFFIDAMQAMEEYGEEMREKSGFDKSPFDNITADRTLKDVVINGDTATGTQAVELMGRTVEVPVHFRKVDGGWRIDALRR